jgi:hypothetical protein
MIYTFIRKRLLPVLAGITCLLLGACSSGKADIDTSISNAEQALTDGDMRNSRDICIDLMANNFQQLDENQLGKLAILFMKLSESEYNDEIIEENVADATQCIRQAWKVSNDSLHSFINTLPQEDIPHFVMLSRISGYIDFPPEISDDAESEGAALADSIPNE